MTDQPREQPTRLPVRIWLWLAGAALVSAAAYLIASAWVYRLGFPLDDAWIHLTYARNLYQYGEWSFIPGRVSAGSTSPLWTLLLSPGFLLGEPPYAWVYFLGIAGLSGVAVLGQMLFRRAAPKTVLWGVPVMGLFLALEWHLVWAAVSGMETILYAAVILLEFALLAVERPKWWVCGLVAGLIVWIRPDGVTLLGPLGLVLLLTQQPMRRKLLSATQAAGSFLAGAIPYLGFNWLLSGTLLPNTFFAKQAEYAALLQIPFLERFLSLISLPMIGAGVLLLPGVCYSAYAAIRYRRWVWLSMVLWWAGYALVYVMRLPVTYQHGRYLIPSMPVYFVLGFIGAAWLLNVQRGGNSRGAFILRNAWAAGLAALLIVFWVRGAVAYASDVAIIESEMVQTAHWLAGEIPADTAVAVHDIGAVGYYTRLDLVDLAGLVSPEVIPFIRDEERLAGYLDERQVQYLVTFPDWYPRLMKNCEEVYSTGGDYGPAASGENMTVCRWQPQ
jgi:hypothetical protein